MDGQTQIANRPDAPIVSVIVPCYNSERTIRQCLTSVFRQQTSVVFEVVVVDSSVDRTAEIVSSEFPQVRLIRLQQRTYPGAARNVGIRATHTPFCWMLDSDGVAAPNVIERALRRHQEGDYAAVAGSLRNGTLRSLSGWVGYLIEFNEFMPTAPLRLEPRTPTANIVYRRSVFDSFGFFDETMAQAEDILFNWQICQAGMRILFDPAIEMTHLNRTGWRNVMRYQVELGRSSARARQRDALPGTFLHRYRFLIPLLPLARLIRAAKWLASHDRKALVIFLILSPMYLLAASFWTVGFSRQVMHKKPT
jgi:glycosyltransferase involved in cell wall biosynthesis